MEHTFMMTLDHVGDQEAMVYAQLGQQPLACTTETSPELNPGTLSCLSARPPDLAFCTGTRPRVVTVSPSTVPFCILQARGGSAVPDSPSSVPVTSQWCAQEAADQTARTPRPSGGHNKVTTRSRTIMKVCSMLLAAVSAPRGGDDHHSTPIVTLNTCR